MICRMRRRDDGKIDAEVCGFSTKAMLVITQGTAQAFLQGLQFAGRKQAREIGHDLRSPRPEFHFNCDDRLAFAGDDINFRSDPPEITRDDLPASRHQDLRDVVLSLPGCCKANGLARSRAGAKA